MNKLEIQNRFIGSGEPTLVIAEIGVNHDGSVARAEELIRVAAGAGADAVKFQLFSADALMHPSADLAAYQKRTCEDASAASMLRRYELRPLEIAHLVEHARSAGLIPLATPFSVVDVHMIEHLELPAIKVASPDLNNRPLLQRIAELGRPVLLSTGASTMAEVARCVAWLQEWEISFALLHCISAYPVEPEHAQLAWIAELAKFEAPVGYSDHTTHPCSGAFAVSAGACIVERHLTHDKSAAGPDHSTSSDPQEFAEYVRLVRLAETMRGTPGKRVMDVERDVRTLSRQSLVIQRDLEAGEQVCGADLGVQRPGIGISAADFARAVGRAARRPIKSGTLLQWDMLSDAA